MGNEEEVRGREGWGGSGGGGMRIGEAGDQEGDRMRWEKEGETMGSGGGGRRRFGTRRRCEDGAKRLGDEEVVGEREGDQGRRRRKRWWEKEVGGQKGSLKEVEGGKGARRLWESKRLEDETEVGVGGFGVWEGCLMTSPPLTQFTVCHMVRHVVCF